MKGFWLTVKMISSKFLIAIDVLGDKAGPLLFNSDISTSLISRPTENFWRDSDPS